MKKFFLGVLIIELYILFVSSPAFSHVPYLEEEDFTVEKPFNVKSIEQSIAVYAWLKFEDGYTEDIDVYAFELTTPSRVFVESLVPECAEYGSFLPSFALVGPGLPEPDGNLPLPLPPGCGAVIIENYQPGEERPTFLEPFGNKSYYRGPIFDKILDEYGTYYLYFWDPYRMGGDYVAIIGYEEIYDMEDIILTLKNTPMIRQNRELHVECK